MGVSAEISFEDENEWVFVNSNDMMSEDSEHCENSRDHHDTISCPSVDGRRPATDMDSETSPRSRISSRLSCRQLSQVFITVLGCTLCLYLIKTWSSPHKLHPGGYEYLEPLTSNMPLRPSMDTVREASTVPGEIRQNVAPECITQSVKETIQLKSDTLQFELSSSVRENQEKEQGEEDPVKKALIVTSKEDQIMGQYGTFLASAVFGMAGLAIGIPWVPGITDNVIVGTVLASVPYLTLNTYEETIPCGSRGLGEYFECPYTAEISHKAGYTGPLSYFPCIAEKFISGGGTSGPP